MEFGKANWTTYKRGIEKEWLLTNGIGGFASSTIIGANSRRYHGLLVSSLKPPVERHLILSKIDESLIIDGKTHNLFSYETSDFVMKGYHSLQRVVIDPLPEFDFNVEGVFIEKKITMVYGENTVAIVYNIINGESEALLRLTPLVNFRNYHHNSSSEYLKFEQSVIEDGILLKPVFYDIGIKLFCGGSSLVQQNDCYFYGMEYAIERERGLMSSEDHYIPCHFEVDLKPGEKRTVTIICTTEANRKNSDGLELIRLEEERLKQLINKAGYSDELAKKLVLAADNFIVYRESTDAKTIIAGYPWFTDWGRDTMIALPGITLSTGRYEDAKEILYTFSRYVKDGLLPNMFPDVGQEPPYNSVDAPLWFFEAAYKYLRYTGDSEFIKECMYDSLKEIIDYYIKGTHYNIKMDDDYMISAGSHGHQLTWMDAKVGDWVVTPRHGKVVEINALWFNALKIMGAFAGKFDDNPVFYEELSEKVKKSFEKLFWNESGGYLYDVITEGHKDPKVRPNQVLALSLSFPIIEGPKAKKILDRIWKDLYTAYGLRTLSPQDSEYKGVYIGNQYSRDGAYHQGTVWTWPLGHFITAYMKTYGLNDKSREVAMKMLKPFRDHLRDAGIGSISEIFDGDEPLRPRGCFAQAWSVGEMLRAYSENVYGSK